MINTLKKAILSSAFAFASVAILQAQAQFVEKVEATQGKIVIPYEKWKLPNGLTILVHEDHSDPIAHVLVTYKVGSNRESIGKSGFAHYFEHMMFQGSKNLADDRHIGLVEDLGGTANGNTDRDRTVYLQTVPSNYLETVLWMESDRMGFLLDSLTTSKFENQRDAVKNEKSQNVENQPYVLAIDEITSNNLYPFKHPYSWPVIGYIDDLNRATVEDVRNFFLRWYGPNNAILTVTGDVNTQDVLKLAEKYFGSLKPCPEVKKIKTPSFTVPTDKYVSFKDKVYLPLSYRVYPAAPAYHRDEPALSILASMMGQGNNSIFYKNFVKSKFAVQASTDYRPQDLAGEFIIGVLANVPEDFNYEKAFSEIDTKIKASIDEFEKTGITDEALQRAKAGYELGLINATSSIAGKADIMKEWERQLGKTSTLSDELDRYNKVTKEDVLRVLNKYVKGTGASVVNVYPILNDKDSVKSINPNSEIVKTLPADPEYVGLTYKPNTDNLDRSKQPIPGTPKTVIIPEYYKNQLKNGLKIIGSKNNETPTVNLFFEIEGGDLFLNNDLKKVGLAEMTAAIMNEGTKKYTTEQIAAELEKIGSYISFSADKKTTSINVTCLKKNVDATLVLLEEKLFNPRFDIEDFKLIKKQFKDNIKNDQEDAGVMASKAFRYALHGNTILGTTASVKTIDNIELEDLKNYYNSYYTPTLTNLVIVGDIDEKEMLPKLEFLNKWGAKEVKIPAIPEPTTTAEPQFFILNKSFAKSSVISMGYPSLKFDATGDYFKNQIANYVFGGSFGSRVNLNLRENKGYTYGIYSGFSGDKYNGTFAIRTSVKRAATAKSLVEIVKEYKNYQDNGITDKELAVIKSSYLNSAALKYESSYDKAGFLFEILTYNLDRDYVTKQNEIINGLTKADINAQIKKSFDINKLTTVIVGDKNMIEAQLDKLGKDSFKDLSTKPKFKKLSID